MSLLVCSACLVTNLNAQQQRLERRLVMHRQLCTCQAIISKHSTNLWSCQPPISYWLHDWYLRTWVSIKTSQQILSTTWSSCHQHHLTCSAWFSKTTLPKKQDFDREVRAAVMPSRGHLLIALPCIHLPGEGRSGGAGHAGCPWQSWWQSAGKALRMTP